MFERDLNVAIRLAAAVLAGLVLCGPVKGQDAPKTAAGGERASMPISFLPPPLDTATYSVGIYDAKTRKLVRRLHEGAETSAFTVGLNGLITSWDGKDDAGKPVPPGKYAARGYAVGDLKVEGKAILGNDWTSADEGLRPKRILAIAMLPDAAGLAILAEGADGRSLVACFKGDAGELRWQKAFATDPSGGVVHASLSASDPWLEVMEDALIANDGKDLAGFRLTDGSTFFPQLAFQPRLATTSFGKDNTQWKIEEGVLSQYSAQGERIRSLAPKEGEPVPVAVAASRTADRLYLLEASKDEQRVRGLSWKENTKEGAKAISNWSTLFANSIRPAYTPTGADNAVLTAQTELALVENPLSPGKPERLKLAATFDARGSYLATADGLGLRQISQRPNLRAVKLGKSRANPLLFYQSDGAAWDEFAIDGAREMMGFDAGEFELTATGEKPAEKPAEPDL